MFTRALFSAAIVLAAGCYGGTVVLGVEATVAAQGGFSRPLDTVPSSDGTTFYFIATTTDSKPGVFRVPATGGSVTLIFSGAPLGAPMGISISRDDRTIYLADPALGVFQLPAAGGTPALLPGTDCMKPRGLDVQGGSGGDTIYFTTGPGACNGGPGLARVAASGGTPSYVAMGSPFNVPTGVAVTSGGDAYVSNPISDGAGAGNIVKVSGGIATQLVGGLSLGHPAGVAVNVAGSILLASGKDTTGHDQVYAIDLFTQKISIANEGIGKNTDGAGLHRAARADLYSWADLTAGGTGAVYRIKLN